MGKNQHIVPRSEHLWAVLGEGNTRDTSHHSTQKAAMQAAREIAKNQKSEMVVHKVNGQFGTKKLLRQRSLSAAWLSDAPRTAPLLSRDSYASPMPVRFHCQCAPANKI